jgi:hypothetical protein
MGECYQSEWWLPGRIAEFMNGPGSAIGHFFHNPDAPPLRNDCIPPLGRYILPES